MNIFKHTLNNFIEKKNTDFEYKFMISKILHQSNLFTSISESFIWIQQLNSGNLDYLTQLIEDCLLSSKNENELILANETNLWKSIFICYSFKTIPFNLN
eukprot:gene6140-10148_t